jgi:transcriptional regulator with XRE-family HTH domain
MNANVKICDMHINKEEFVKKIGARIREVRIEKKMTIEELAFDAEIEYVQLSRIELGKINTSIYHIYKISHSLSVPVMEFFTLLYVR